MIRLLQPRVPNVDAALGYVRRSEEARHWTNFGPNVKDLEARLSEHYAGAYVVTCSSCTAGLELAYTLKCMQGYRSIELPSLTFPATWLAANRSGLTIKPIDVDPETWIAPGVSGFGLPSYAPVVDAAGAFGEQQVPLIKGGMTAVFSLHATKPLGAGEGGFVVTWDQDDAEQMRRMSNFGFDKGASRGPGWNAKLSEIQAAMALAALDAWDREPWLQLDGWYRKHLPAGVVAQKRPPGAYSLMPVKLPVPAQPVLERMLAAGVETKRYYVPLMTCHPMFQRSRTERRKNPWKLPVSEMLAERLICLPFHSWLTEADVERVCETLDNVVTDQLSELDSEEDRRCV